MWETIMSSWKFIKACSQESHSVKATCLNESSFIRVTQHHQTIQMTSQHNTCTVNTPETSVSTEFLKIYSGQGDLPLEIELIHVSL